MRHNLQISFFLVLLFSFGSCKEKSINQTAEAPPPKLYVEVMEIHDEVMPKTADIHRYKRDLKKIKDSLQITDEQFFNVIKTLEDADENMMVWMAEFKMPSDTNLVTPYLENEKIKIQKVSDDIYSSLENAQSLKSKYLNQ